MAKLQTSPIKPMPGKYVESFATDVPFDEMFIIA
jgi:hypothetical protein